MVQGSGNAPASYAVTPTEKDIYTAVRAWLLSALPSGFRVIQGQQNRAAPPPDPFAVMTIIGRERLATNGWSYTDTSRTITEQTQLTMQVSLFGCASSNQMETITMLWRDFQAVDWFRSQSIPIAPLNTSSTRQLGFLNGEKQYEDCWSADLLMQVNFTASVPQQFADTLSATLIEVDTTYPPTE